MESIALRPSQRMFTKTAMVIASVSVFIVFLGIIIQIAIALGGNTNAEKASALIWALIAIVVLIKWIIALPIAVLWIKNLAYVIQDDRIIVYRGIITKIEQNIPYRAITDFMLHRSLFDRILGIGSIRIQTAGQSHSPEGYEGIIYCITDYTNIMDILRDHLKKFHSTGTHLDDITENGKNIYSEELLKEIKLIRSILENKN